MKHNIKVKIILAEDIKLISTMFTERFNSEMLPTFPNAELIVCNDVYAAKEALDRVAMDEECAVYVVLDHDLDEALGGSGVDIYKKILECGFDYVKIANFSSDPKNFENHIKASMITDKLNFFDFPTFYPYNKNPKYYIGCIKKDLLNMSLYKYCSFFAKEANDIVDSQPRLEF